MEEKDVNSTEENINQQTEQSAEEIVEKVEQESTDDNLILPLKEGENIAELIEPKRKEIIAKYKKEKLIGRIATIVAMALIIGAIILITFNQMVATIFGFVLAGLALVGMIVFYFTTKKAFPNASKIYIKDVTSLLNSYIYSDKAFSDVHLHGLKKVSKTEMALDRAYKEGDEVGSRNDITGKFNDKEFEVIECAIYYPGEKRNTRKVGFLGRYLTLKNNLKFEGRYIFNLKNKDPQKVVDQPTDIEDLAVLTSDEDLMIYGPEGTNINSIFGSDFVKKLRKFKIEEPLLNIVVVFWEGHTALYLSYDDSVNTLPFEHEFKPGPVDTYRDHLIQMLTLLSKY